ncbi:MAG: nucleotidyltransferase, partial [Firmicutes bacterium]|nr:nucleotidyltransferase [Bacillota bacterium]
VTYQQDRPLVEQALRNFALDGVYPETLWGEQN